MFIMSKILKKNLFKIKFFKKYNEQKIIVQISPIKILNEVEIVFCF